MKNIEVDEILLERAKRYDIHGSYKDHAELTQALKQIMRAHPGWNHLSGDMKESLDMIQHKIARILNGDPTYDDNWNDIIGYATLIYKTL